MTRPLVSRWSLPLSLVGTLLVLAAPAHAVSSRTLMKLTGAAPGDEFGHSVAGAGDVNGDGFPDLIVGAPYDDAGGVSTDDRGRAYVYYGGPSADGIADITLTGAAPGDYFGSSVGGAGDVNGDGFPDLIVGAPQTGASGVGRAYVYYGGPVADAAVDLTITGAAVADYFGSSVAGAGDVNGDGFADLIVGAFGAGGIDAGGAFVYYGGSAPNATADLSLSGEAAVDMFGFSVAGAGDVNGDGFADLIVGAPARDNITGNNAGKVYVYYGGPAADATADFTTEGSSADDRKGHSVAGAGDVNGDGFDDLIVGATQNDAGGTDAGRAYVYYGGRTSFLVTGLVLTGAAAFDLFGESVAGAGDVNGDGFADLIVGARRSEAGGGGGRAYVYYGGPSADATADLTLTGVANDDLFGISAGAGDVNGDGFADVVVGASGNDAAGFGAGQAYVLTGRPYEVLSPNGGEQWVTGQPSTVRWRGHDAADLAISFDGGVNWGTLASGVGGGEVNAFTVIAPGQTTAFARVRVCANGEAVSFSTSDVSDGVFRIVPPAAPIAHRLQLTPTGAAAFDAFGVSVADAGDVDGDGYPDLIVGARANDAGGADAGRAYVYYGGLAADATADLILTGAAADDNFGVSVAGAGDVNGDGFADLIVGANLNDAAGFNAGRAYVYFGGPAADATADLTLVGSGGGGVGTSVAGAGDVNADGYADLIVGAPLNDIGGTNAGRAYIYYGGPAADGSADMSLTGAAAGDEFGISVAGAGDVNGDGFADVIVGAYLNDAGGSNAGRAYVYYGGPLADATADLILTGAAASDFFGYSVAGAGDVNGDGFADLIVGTWYNSVGGARAYVYWGGPAADAVADLTLTGAAADDAFGWSVAGAGDVNRDGFADLIVGAHQNDAGGSYAGRAYIYYGGPTADAVADFTLTGAAAGDFFGISVAGAGDVNRDGFADLIVGANGNDAGGASAGRAYVYDCNRYAVLAPNDDEVWNVGAAAGVSWLGAEPADLWLSADAGATWQLLQSDVGGSATNAVTVQVPHMPTRFARVRVTPADVNVIGEDRSDSLFTIQSSVALLSLVASLTGEGANLSWSTDPGVGPQGLAGYRLYRIAADASGNGARIGPELIAENRYTDRDGAPGHVYRLVGVNGLQEELELGRVGLAPAMPLAAWPLPLRGGTLSVSFATGSGLGGGAGEAEVELYDLTGRKVRTLARGRFDAGYHAVQWDGLDERGAAVRNGIYFLRARSAGADHRMKVVVAR